MNYIPVTGYEAVRACILWPQEEGAGACSSTERLGNVYGLDPEGPNALYVGAGKVGVASGTWTVDIGRDRIEAKANLILPVGDDDSLQCAMQGLWNRLLADLESRGIHELVA